MSLWKYHLMAVFSAVVWGASFISSKVLLGEGMTPTEIMLCRFFIGYILLCVIHPHFRRVSDWHDEFIFLMTGLLGGTLYFLAENTALKYTQASNVGLICAVVPIVTALFSRFVFKTEKFKRSFVIGALISFVGVAMVVLNGQFQLKLNPLGDLLTFAAVVFWALYCVIQKLYHHTYPSLFVTRKLFFYGLLTTILYFMLFSSFDFPIEHFAKPAVYGNLLFLGVVASGICFLFWNKAMDELGVIITNNYVFLMPMITVVFAHFILDETLTPFIVVGSILIIGGLWWTNRGKA